MKIFQKIEDLLNWLLSFLRSFLGKIFNQTVPDKIQKKIDKQNHRLHKHKHILDKKLSRFSDHVIVRAGSLGHAIKNQAIAKSSNAVKNYKKVRDYDYAGLTPAKIMALLTLVIAPFFIKAQKWIIALKPSSIAAIMITTSITAVSTVKIYSNSLKIAKDEKEQEEVNRMIASVAPHRPDHYNVNDRQFKIYNLALPVFFDGEKTRRPIKLDLTIETSNKYTRNYLDKNYQLVEDYLNTEILPMLPPFLLEREGKEVFKNKVKIELDKLIHERGMKGNITNVYIDSMLSS